MKILGIDFIYIAVSDFDKALVFYRDTLGLKPYKEPNGAWVEFEIGNATLSVGKFDDYKPKERYGTTVGLAVDDVPNAIKELSEKGVKVEGDVQDWKVCHSATILDPDGNKIMLHHRTDGTVG